MSLIPLLKRHVKTLRWLEMPEAEELLQALSEKRNSVAKKLRSEKDPIELHRLQGKAEILDSIVDLKKDLVNYLDRVRKGEVSLPGKEGGK